MNKTDRLLAIVLKLQSSGGLRAEDLAATFETSKRTIYRDIQALSEAGVPIMATPGQGYALVEGYFLPPLSFSSAEATMLLLGGQYIAQNFDDHYRVGAEAACLKIEGVLPPPIRQEVARLQGAIRFIATPTENSGLLRDLRRAVIESRRVRFRYYARHHLGSQEPPPGREADPYGLIFFGGAWYMTAYCHLRQERRNFRLDRLEDLHLTSATFQRPADFKLEQTQAEQGRDLTVRVLFDPTLTRWVQESQFFYITDEEETPEGLLVTLRVRQESDVLSWLLGWGGRVRVLEPFSLQERLLESAREILQIYQNS